MYKSKLILLLLLLSAYVCFGTKAKVIRIIDGDTFEIETQEKVRLIGINAPEISDIFGYEAKQHLANLIEGKVIDLESDNISNDKDRYSRLLRYVILEGNDINKQMITDGYAFAYLKYHFGKMEEYKQAQIDATKNGSGMWGSKEKNETPTHQEARAISPKVYLIGILVVLLICIGVYSYLKK